MYVDNVNYINMRLSRTVVRDEKGFPVYVYRVHEDMNVEYSMIGNNDAKELGLRGICELKKLDLSSPPLGYTNVHGCSFFITRIPKREDWRQGLRYENLGVYNHGRMNRWPFRGYSALIPPITRNYPSFNDSLAKVRDVHSSCAFSRVFSVNEEFKICYKGRLVVGKINAKEKPVLYEKFLWLEETLKEEIHHVK